MLGLLEFGQRRRTSRTILTAPSPVDSVLEMSPAGVAPGLFVIELGLRIFVRRILVCLIGSRLAQCCGRTGTYFFQVHDRPAAGEENETQRERP